MSFRPFAHKKDESDPQKEKARLKSEIRQMCEAYKLATEIGKAIYRLRKSTVEPVFGIIKEILGFRQFSLRGLKNVTGEWCLVCLAYNLKNMHSLWLANELY